MSDIFIPEDPKDYSIRPLDKGMFRDVAPNGIQVGGFFTIKNYMVTPKGLKRRAGFGAFSAGGQLPSGDRIPVLIVPLWKTDGTQNVCLLTRRYLYQLSGYSAPSAVYWEYSDGTVSVTDAVVTGDGTTWNNPTTDYLKPGDSIILDADGTPEEATISSVDSETQITLTASPSGTYGAGTDYVIRRNFGYSKAPSLDYAICDNKVVIADHYRPPYSYDGTTFTIYDTSITYVPSCLTFFNDRLWMGNTVESATVYRNRVRWSEQTDHTDFAVSNYVDLPYMAGELRRLIPMGSLLAAYFRDAIYLARATNITTLPFNFFRVETGGVGLAGTRAIVSIPNGHYFIGQNDIYLLSNEGLKRLKCPVRDLFFTGDIDPDRSYVSQDPMNKRIVFGFSGDDGIIDKVWSYYYEVDAWAYDSVDTYLLENPMLDLDLTYEDLKVPILSEDTYAGLGVFPTYEAMSAPISAGRLFISRNGYVYRLSETSAEDAWGGITGEIETGDLDFNIPDRDKTITKLHLRITSQTALTEDLTFKVKVSDNGGRTWRDLSGNLVIVAGEKEGKIDFRATGSCLRFRITESGASGIYTITELGMRVQGRGWEFKFE